MFSFIRRLIFPSWADLPQLPAGWDNLQSAVIQAPASSRILVNGGPGTGKTAVACARITHLVESGIAPSRIRVVSFTRTAIREVRERIDIFNQDGGFVFNAVHNIQGNSPIENVLAIFKAIRDSGC